MSTKADIGLKRTIAFYALGVILTVLAHLFRGFKSPEVPPSSFYVLVIFSTVGFIWLLVDIFLIFVRRPAVKAKADLAVHVIGLLVFGILISLILLWGAGAPARYETNDSSYSSLAELTIISQGNHYLAAPDTFAKIR